jgi:hypothetical protein
MPFYRMLMSLRKAEPDIRVVGLSPEDISVSDQYLQKHQVRFDSVLKVPLSRLKVRGTPTAILVDRAGVVQAIWPGMLDEAKQQELLLTLRQR